MVSGKAKGKCGDFAQYQILVFKQLGIKGYYATNYVIGHGCSVIKVKNSDGKLMYIACDYNDCRTFYTGKDWKITSSSKITKEAKNNKWTLDDVK